jgi:hypothetical protein
MSNLMSKKIGKYEDLSTSLEVEGFLQMQISSANHFKFSD